MYTLAHTNDEVDYFYDLLNKAWNIVLTDFNADFGMRLNLDEKDLIGPYGLGA